MLTQAQTLAKKLTALGPRAGVARFSELAEQAQVVGDYTGHLTAIRMAELMTDPADWYQAAAESGETLLLGTALTQWLTTAPDTVPPSVLLAALDDAASRPTVISAVVARSVVDQTGELVIDSMRAEDAALLETLIRHEPDDVMQRLLVHTVPAIAASAAISFSVGAPHGPTLPAEWQTSWRRAINNLRIDHLPPHNQWRAGRVLAHLAEHDADTFESWFHERLKGHDRPGLVRLAAPARERSHPRLPPTSAPATFGYPLHRPAPRRPQRPHPSRRLGHQAGPAPARPTCRKP